MSTPKKPRKRKRYVQSHFFELVPGTVFRDADEGSGKRYVKMFLPFEEQRDPRKANSQRLTSKGEEGGYRHFSPNTKVFATQVEMDRATDALVQRMNRIHP